MTKPHSTQNLPIILDGGGDRLGGPLAFDESNNTPLANLYVTMPNRLGVETDRFSSSTATLAGLNV